HRLGRAAKPRDQLSHRVRRCAQQPAPGRLLDAPAYGRFPRCEKAAPDAPAYGQCPRCERQRLGQRRLRLLLPAQLELPTCQSARRPILYAAALVVRRGTPPVTIYRRPAPDPVSKSPASTYCHAMTLGSPWILFATLSRPDRDRTRQRASVDRCAAR